MGTLQYAAIDLEIKDRDLAHLEAVIMNKLRNHQAFFFSCKDRKQHGAGRRTLWLHAAIPLVFTYDNAIKVPLDRKWLQQLLDHANSPGGLIYSPEPDQASQPHTDGRPSRRI